MSDKDYERLAEHLASEASKRLGISKAAALNRVRALVKSGILNRFGPPDGVPFKAAIDAAMQIPQMTDEANMN